jgi:hypothetical protein
VANVVSAAIRFRRPLPIGASDTSPHHRINVQIPRRESGGAGAGGGVAEALSGATGRAHEVAAPL